MAGPVPMPTEEFVRRILHEREVEVRYFVDPKTGSPSLPDFSLRADGWKRSDSKDSVALCFPIAPQGARPAEMRASVHGFSKGDPPGSALTQKVLERHYDMIEPRVLVKPILALAQVSPEAFAVLRGDWQVYEPMGISSDGALDQVEHLVFRMVFAAIRELSESRTVPDESIVREVRVSGVSNLAQRHGPPLLEVVLKDDSIVGYNAGFDTNHLFYQGEDDGPEGIGEVPRNPEDCWVEVWWDQCPPSWSEQSFEGSIGYRFEDKALLKQVLEESSRPGRKRKRPILFRQAAWLGDRILGEWTVSTLLARLNSEKAKDLDQLREQLTSNAALARVGRKLGLTVTVQPGYPSGNPRKVEAEEGMLGDSVEALIGAAYLDGGLKAAHAVTKRIMMRPLEALVPTGYPIDFLEGRVSPEELEQHYLEVRDRIVAQIRERAQDQLKGPDPIDASRPVEPPSSSGVREALSPEPAKGASPRPPSRRTSRDPD